MPQVMGDAREDEASPDEAPRWHPPEEQEALARRLDLPRVAWLSSVSSTMDMAERLAREGTPGGTLVLADVQTRGRGRTGKEWRSPSGGLWMTVIERPIDGSGLDVLSLRVGLRVARVLDRFAGGVVALKWPNDLMLPSGKVGGILVEARWRERRPEWVAIGIGINLGNVPIAGGAALDAAILREDVLGELVPAARSAAAADGPLTAREVEAYAARDWARGRRVTSPHAGTVVGVSATGAVLIETSGGIVACRSGSLLVEGEPA